MQKTLYDSSNVQKMQLANWAIKNTPATIARSNRVQFKKLESGEQGRPPCPSSDLDLVSPPLVHSFSSVSPFPPNRSHFQSQGVAILPPVVGIIGSHQYQTLALLVQQLKYPRPLSSSPTWAITTRSIVPNLV